MQTERVTFLTTPDHKAALDAFAASNGISTGHVVREATLHYIADGEADQKQTLAVLTREIEAAVPRMRADLQEAIAAIDQANRIVDRILAGGSKRP